MQIRNLADQKGVVLGFFLGDESFSQHKLDTTILYDAAKVFKCILIKKRVAFMTF